MRKKIWRRWWVWLFAAVLAIILVVHFMLATWVRDYVNRKLSEIPGYQGHVAAVTLHLWRGAYQIHKIDITKTSGDVPVPFFSAPLVDLSVEWKALFNGAFVGEIYFNQPQLNFVNGRSEEDTQVGIDKPWTQKIKELFPLKINRFVVHDGQIHYRDFHRRPKVDVVFDRVRMLARNLTNSEKLSKTLHAHIQMEGRPLRTGDLRGKIDLNPYASKPTFSTQAEMRDVPLVKLNDFAKAYAGITFESGTLGLATELDARNGKFTGHIEPVFDHMSIFNPQHDIDNPIDFIWQGIVGGLTRIIRNQPRDRFATRIPLSGTFDEPQPAMIATILNVFKNALIKAFEGKLDQDHTKLPEVPENQK